MENITMNRTQNLTLHSVIDAIQSQAPVSIRYGAGTHGTDFRQVVPETVYHKGGNTYIGGECQIDHHFKLFRVDRLTD
jgi:predicted DNA-binding transcriptional regulator YafY